MDMLNPEGFAIPDVFDCDDQQALVADASTTVCVKVRERTLREQSCPKL